MKISKFLYSVVCVAYIFLVVFFIVIPVHAYEENALFAGGCFWCLEHDLEQLDGVLSAESGYSGGKSLNPNYNNHQGHQESVSVIFDPEKITFERLVRNYLLNIDPLDDGGQFCDRGDSYRPVIFYKDDNQKRTSLNSIKLVSDAFSIPLQTFKVEVTKAGKFWKAEDYHQDYAENNRIKYNFYRASCGRDRRLKEVWGDSAGKEVKFEEIEAIVKEN